MNRSIQDPPARTLDRVALQEAVRAYWNAKPCDSELSHCEPFSREYFLEIERRRYALQPHIAALLSSVDWRGKEVLEIGTGVGTDARRMIRSGAAYTGINVDMGSTEATLKALRLFGLPGTVLQRSATALEFPDARFDIVYSFGVLHHVPDAEKAVGEIRRVLKPGGELVVMLYNRTSVNYVVEIMFLRKLGLRLLSLPGGVTLLERLGMPREKLRRHVALRRKRKRMSDEEWLSRNTDGPDNPYSAVYGADETTRLLAGFRVTRSEIHFFDHTHWGIVGRMLPRGVTGAIGRRWGWHRIVHAQKEPSCAA